MTSATRFDRYITARDTAERLTQGTPLILDSRCQARLPTVSVDTNRHFQTFEGFGGAFTEAAATVLYRLSPENRQRVLSAYFGWATGHGYSLCRTHINSCDFALGNYAYDEVPGDVVLKHFSIERDRRALLPMIHAAQKVAGTPLKILASPWSPPAWMKTNGQMNHGGTLKPEYRDAWARYFARYMREYEREGVPIWAVTVQNEPAAAQPWESCLYSVQEERDFVRDHLGPTLQQAGLGHVKILIWDHNRDLLVERARVVYDDPQASRYIWGAAFHWYGPDKFENVQLVHDTWPDKHLLFTEGCQEGGPHLGSWELGERYAHSLINDLNRWTVGWIDWNLVLDKTGGPNHAGNFCSAPIIADTRTDRLIFQSSYYYLGHFSRFIQPAAVRILCTSTDEELEVTGFVNPDGSLAVVVLNRTDEACKFQLRLADRSGITTVPAHSISTYRSHIS
ncbi:MAG TPA: glycoside hydrolase family 30 protein [Verrucomicrobiae bacterium]|nr:glycoside hydrolase family 30 protein [Verrucomicrobiae bacterium]